MLSARKIHLAAGLKVSGLDLRKAELDFHVSRYIAISGVSSIQTGLAYVGIIKIRVPEKFHAEWANTDWQVFAFYVSVSLTLAFALLNLIVPGTDGLVVELQLHFKKLHALKPIAHRVG